MEERSHDLGQMPFGKANFRMTSTNQEMLGPHVRVDEHGKENLHGDLVSLDAEVAHQVLYVENHPLEIRCYIIQARIFQLIVQFCPLLQGCLEHIKLTF